MMGRAVRVFIYYISRTLLLTFYLLETAMLFRNLPEEQSLSPHTNS